MRRATYFFAAATASATIITADIGNSRQLHLHAAHTIETPLPSFSDALALVVAGAGCGAFIKPTPAATLKPFALLARRGECSFDTKMDVAINSGASALLVAETLSTEYAPPNASRGRALGGGDDGARGAVRGELRERPWRD